MLKHWRKFVADKVRAAMVGQEAFFLQPIVADFTFYVRRPGYHFGARGLLPSAPKYPIRTPDLDKLARAIMDSITDGEAWDDDARVVDMNVRKRFETTEHQVGVVITIKLKENDDDQGTIADV
jgi:Holliday junction resolvase RusA-like endonuclease